MWNARAATAQKIAAFANLLAAMLGAALLSATTLALAAALDGPPPSAPQRLAAARTVVRGLDVLHVSGTRGARLPEPVPLPGALVGALKALGPTVEDRTFPVRADHVPGDIQGHPWSTAALAGYHLSAGRAPTAPNEAAVAGGWAAPGATVRTGSGTLHIVGTLAPATEDSLFLTDARAAEIDPPLRQLAVQADPARVSALVAREGGATVLRGKGLRAADPGGRQDDLTPLAVVLGTSAGVTGFVVVFVVSSTTALSVAGRRREFGLLRTIGATPGQLRRTVLAESLLLALPASAAGCGLGGAYGARLLARWAVNGGLAPGWYTVSGHTHLWPYPVSFATGVAAALCGSVAASWRAGRTAPAEALRAADADRRALTPGRAVAGGALLLGALALAAYTLTSDPSDLLHRKSYVSRPMLLISAVSLLSPALVRPLVRLLAVRGMLVREQAAAAVRRTAAVAGPVLVTVALAGSLLGGVATVNAAKSAEIRRATTADLVLTAAGGLDAAALARAGAVPGVARASAVTTGTVFTREDGVALIRSDAWAVDPATLPGTARLPLVAGRLADLDDDSIVVNAEWQQHTVGCRVTVWLADGTRRTLRVAAVLATGTGGNGVYLTPHNSPRGAAPTLVRFRLAPAADPAAVTAALHRAVAGAEIRTGAAWARATAPHTTAATRLGLALTLGIALAYAALALAAALAMSTASRARDLTLLRLSGATRLQVLRLVAAESLLVVAVGAVLGLPVALLDLAGMRAALAGLGVHSPLVLPWQALGGTVAACAAVAVAASVVPAALLMAVRGAAARS
ncbi:FtsX-like permease family protein [Streptomyces sp. NBC_01198]|uniref:FtsX-like permease family protein n=1 Tax=Streptomyces sp. NBC_01198 TaxID=2903769 RepID=UPI002E164C96|nr:FtsX-like permease family protein [Streptomyces sp. NBC_01198]